MHSWRMRFGRSRQDHPDLESRSLAMTEKSNPAFKYLEVFKNLAEGRYDLNTWLAWWNEHKAELEAVLPPGWTLRLKPIRSTQYLAPESARLLLHLGCPESALREI